MQQSSIDILEKHYHYWITLRDADYIKYMDYQVKQELLSVACKEIGLCNVSLWCGNCLAEMIRSIYRHYDNYKTKQNESN